MKLHSLLFVLTATGCLDATTPESTDVDLGDSAFLAEDDVDFPQLVDLDLLPEGEVVMSAPGTESEAISEFARVLSLNNITGDFQIRQAGEDSWDLVLLEAGPGTEEEVPLTEPAAVCEGTGGETSDFPTPPTTYYHDYVYASGTGSYSTNVNVGDDLAMTYAVIISGKRYHMSGSASWASSATFVSFLVTEAWRGVGLSLSAGYPSGITVNFSSSTYGTVQMSGTASGTRSSVSWCMDGPRGTSFTSRTITGALTVRSGSSTYLLSRSGTSYFVYDWTNTSNAC
jgi:hypothetical protein